MPQTENDRIVNVYGVGGLGKVCLEVLRAAGVNSVRLFDDDPSIESLGGYRVERSPSDQDAKALTGTTFLCFQTGSLREEFSRRFSEPEMFVAHPSTVISEQVSIGNGSAIFHGAVLQAGTSIGRHVFVNTAASIDHDCDIADFVHIAPNSTLCGLVTVGRRSEIGAGATVLPTVTIGQDCRVGAGAVVLHDVPDGAVIVGNPGRVIKIYGERVG